MPRATEGVGITNIGIEDMPHCVIKDIYYNEEITNAIQFSSDKEIDEWKTKWEPANHSGKNYGYVTYKLYKDGESDSFPDSSFEHRALTIALRQWGLRIKDIKFKRIYGDERADIEVKFQKREDNQYFMDKATVLAYAYFPQKSNIIGGDMVFYDSIFWSKNGASRSAHELDPTNYPDENTKVKFKWR